MLKDVEKHLDDMGEIVVLKGISYTSIYERAYKSMI